MFQTECMTAQTALAPDGPLAEMDDAVVLRPTTSPHWLRAYYSAFGRMDRDPVIVVRHAEDGRVAGYLALTWKFRGPGGAIRELWSTTNGHSQYCALVARAGDERPLLEALLVHLDKRRDWDRLYLQGLPVPWPELISARARRFRPQVAHQFENRIVACDPASPNAGKLPSNKTLRKIRGQLRSLSDQGEVRLEVISDPSDLPQALDRYLEAERKSWKHDGGEILGDGGAIEAFYRRLIAEADGEHCPEIRLYTFEGEVVAGLFLLRRGGDRVALKLFHDARYAKHSLGRNLLFGTADDSRADPGCRQLDLFSNWSKYDALASHTEPFADILLWNRSLRASVARVAHRGLAGVRQLRKKEDTPPTVTEQEQAQ
jgi:CelD/BcsL family acetyltransferase involved in cellulose biosynthesis